MTDSKGAKHRRLAVFRQYLAAIVANLSAFLVGNILGWTSPMQPLLASANPPVGLEPVSPELISWLGSINFLGAVVGSLFWGISSDRLGRKVTAVIVAVPFIISWTLKLTAQNIWWLIAARVIVGVGCSGVAINTPIYVAEMAEDKIRGSLGSFLMMFLNAGCVFSYVMGSLTSYHILASACLSISIIVLVCISFLPESPVHLWTQGNKTKCEESLLWFRGGNSLQTLKEIESFSTRSVNVRETPSFKSLFSSKGVRKAMLIGITFVLGQQLCGILAILTYTVSIFQESGSSLSPHNSMIIVGIMQLLSAVLSAVLVDRAGRRLLLISSYTAMSISLSTLGGFLYLQNGSWHTILRWLPIFCISVVFISYSIGVGPVPFVVMSEIFPQNIRGYATSRIQLLNTILSFVTIKIFPFLSGYFGSHGCFLFYAACCALLSITTYCLVPETKGTPLHVILNKLNGEVSVDFKGTETSELFNSKKYKIVKLQTA